MMMMMMWVFSELLFENNVFRQITFYVEATSIPFQFSLTLMIELLVLS